MGIGLPYASISQLRFLSGAQDQGVLAAASEDEIQYEPLPASLQTDPTRQSDHWGLVSFPAWPVSGLVYVNSQVLSLG